MDKYIAVVYLKNGHIDLSKPFDTQEEAISFAKATLLRGNNIDKVKATTISKRSVESLRDGFMFGHPAKYDLMQDRKFLKEAGR